MKYILVILILLASLLAITAQDDKPKPKVEIEESSSLDNVAAGPGDNIDIGSVGERLFHDTRLSVNGKVACITCHPKANGFASKGLPPNINGGFLERRAPSILNRADGKFFFWDGRSPSLEDQALLPITNPDEMGKQTLEEVLERIKPFYPTVRTKEDLARELAKYERTLVTPPNRLDGFLKGKDTLTEAEARGWEVFRGAGHCTKCHTLPNFTDEKFHNTGIGIVQYSGKEKNDYGRFTVTGVVADRAAFKTPGLRNCRDTGPWMHDASLKTLEDVVEFYDKGGVKHKALDKEIKVLNLTPRQKRDLVTLLKVL